MESHLHTLSSIILSRLPKAKDPNEEGSFPAPSPHSSASFLNKVMFFVPQGPTEPNMCSAMVALGAELSLLSFHPNLPQPFTQNIRTDVIQCIGNLHGPAECIARRS
jgi:hypothetical protein